MHGMNVKEHTDTVFYSANVLVLTYKTLNFCKLHGVTYQTTINLTLYWR
jgi:hypothetical protein